MSKLVTTKRSTPAVVGLDIGSTSVRAAEVVRTRRGQVCRRFAQVGLPHGAVVDGEVVQAGTVATALRRLWSEAGFGTRNVVVAVSGQRVIVRQAEVLTMSESDFRSALHYQAMDLIPIPVDDAVLDFVILPPDPDAPKHSDRMKILLAAAHRDVVGTHLAVLREASLRAVAIDPSPMAAVRGSQASGTAGDGTVAVVDIGSDLTLIALREQGTARFSRILNAGGSDLTERVAERLSVAREQAESLKRSGSVVGGDGALLLDEVDPLVAEIESSLSFFATQLGGTELREVFVTGGPSRSPELIAELSRRLPVPVGLLDPLEGLECDDLALDGDARVAASATSLLSIGAAQWVFDQPGRRVSLLPGDVAAAAAARRRVMAVVAGVAVVAVGLGCLSEVRDRQVSHERAEAAALRVDNTRTLGQVTALLPVSEINSDVQARLAILTAAGADNVAWTQLLARIAAAMPPGTMLTSVNLSDTSATGTSGGSTASTAPTASATGEGTDPDALGSVSMSVSGPGSEEQVAIWLRALDKVKGLEAVWVPSAAVAGGKVTFTSSATVSAQAPLVARPSTTGAKS